MKICVIGGGPGGLYFSISVKRRMPEADVVLFERNSPDTTFGWGVVFSSRTRETLLLNDADSANRLADEFIEWDTIETVLDDQSVSTGGYPFNGIDRCRLLNILSERCIELGVDVRYGEEVSPGDSMLEAYDLVVAADGVNSRFRSEFSAALGATERLGVNRYIWLGTKAVFEKFHFVFKRSGSHWIWAHAYPFDNNTSTFIVECGLRTWREAGFGEAGASAGCGKLAELFSDVLGGRELLINGEQNSASSWDRFRQVACRRWSAGKIVLIGDAAHTIHFSIGSGTKQAFDDGICLADALSGTEDVSAAVDLYETTRKDRLSRLKAKGDRSMRWFEEAGAYADRLKLGEFESALLNRAADSVVKQKLGDSRR